MPDAATREYSVTYGGFTVGGAIGTQNGYHLTGFHEVRVGAETAAVGFDVIVVASAESAFAARCAAIEAAFRKPFQDLAIALGSSVIRSFSHSGNTGFDADPSIAKEGDETTDSGRSRRYRCSVEFGIPADRYPTEGLRESRVGVEQTPAGRKTARISGTFTAVAGNTARQQYAARIGAFASSALSVLSITNSELVEDTSAHNTTNKTIEFTRVYRELIFGQAGASLDDTELKEQSLRITIEDEAPGDTSDPPKNAGGSGLIAGGGTASRPSTSTSVHRLSSIRADYEAWVDASQTTDLPGKYAEIRTWIVSQMKSDAGNVGAFALVLEAPEYDHDDNRIRATLRAQAATKGQDTIEREITVRDSVQEGWVIDPVWNGDPLAGYLYQGPSVIRRTITVRQTVLGETSALEAGHRAGSLAAGLLGQVHASSSGGNAGWVVEDRDTSVTPRTVGLKDYRLTATVIAATVTFRQVNVATGGRIRSRAPTTQGGR